MMGKLPSNGTHSMSMIFKVRWDHLETHIPGNKRDPRPEAKEFQNTERQGCSKEVRRREQTKVKAKCGTHSHLILLEMK
jgi:hypothetical protein